MHTLVEVTTAGNGSSHVPAFLAKLWKIVDDPTTNDLICWSQMGNSFIIRNQAKFARDLLPLYYKHNNMASFVRQLNMYGFHKVVSVEQGGLRLEKDEMEFAHPFFLRGQEGSLELIKRKIPTTKHEDTRTRPDSLNKVLLDVRQMKGRQESMDTKLITMKRENEALWRELSSLRQKHAKQTQIVSKLLQFLVGMMSSQTHRLGFKRRMPLMLNDTVGAKPAKMNRTKNGTENRGPVIHDVTELFECNEADEADEASAEDSNETDEPNVESPSSTSVKSPYPPDALYGLGSVDETVDMLLSVDPLSINPAINVSRKQTKPANKKAKSQTPKPSPKASESSGATIVSQNSQVQQIMPQMMSQSAIPSTVDQNLPTYFLAGMDDNGQIILTIPDNSNVTQTSNVANILIDQNTSASVSPGSEQLSTDIVPVHKETTKQKQRNQGATPNSFLKPKFELKDDFDEHLDDVQHGLDNLRDLLKNEQYSIDSSTLLGVGSNNPFNMHNNIDAFSVAKLFGDESNEILGLQQQQLMNQPPVANTAETNNDGQAQSSELVSYNPSLFELTEDDTNFFDEATNMYLSHELDSMLTTDRDKLNQGNGYSPLSFSEVIVGNPNDSNSINTPVVENPVMTFNFDDFSSPAPPAPPVNTLTAPSTSGAAKRKRK